MSLSLRMPPGRISSTNRIAAPIARLSIARDETAPLAQKRIDAWRWYNPQYIDV
jgi:hypothetical protein